MRIDVLGVGFDNLTMQEAVARGAELLEQEGCLDYVREGPEGAVQARVTVYGNPGRFSIAVRDGPAGTELAVSITEPRPGLSPEGQRRAENYLADRVEQLMENELRLEPLARSC